VHQGVKLMQRMAQKTENIVLRRMPRCKKSGAESFVLNGTICINWHVSQKSEYHLEAQKLNVKPKVNKSVRHEKVHAAFISFLNFDGNIRVSACLNVGTAENAAPRFAASNTRDSNQRSTTKKLVGETVRKHTTDNKNGIWK
jgi:hypothetical protein